MNQNQDNYKRTFIASSELFSGFKVEIQITRVDSINEIINYFVNELTTVLEENNFENLLSKLNNNKLFHIHGVSIEDILTSNPDHIFYLCDHC
jgi:hypothetical protein